MSAIHEPTLRFPSSLSHRERELWEREAAHLGYFTESAQEVMERHPIEEGEGQILYRKRIETIRRSEAAIEDGRKEEPSQNARTHGFTAKTFRLAPGEREEDYQVRISDSLRRHQPQDTEELDQVVIIVNATWQLLRIQCAASDLMCLNFEEGTTASDALLLHNGTDFNSLARYEGTQNRTLDKARKRLKELKADNVRGAGVPPAKEEPTSPVAEEHQTQITKRTAEMVENTPSPFPGRERAGVRDGSNDQASKEITKRTQQSDRGVSACPEQSRGVSPANEEPYEPQSPRAREPQQKITKRTHDEGSTEISPTSRQKPALHRNPEPHANNRRPKDPSHLTPHPSRLDSPEERELCTRARTFLASQSWCRSVGEAFLAWGLPKLALCLTYASSRDEGRWIWVVAGDLPPAYVDIGYCPTAEEALKTYLAELLAWLQAANQGEPSSEFMPMLHPTTFTQLKATPEVIRYVESRAQHIQEKILGEHGEDLRRIKAHESLRTRHRKPSREHGQNADATRRGLLQN